MENIRTRDNSIDWLKTIGTLCLFLAHVDAPFVIKEIRGFDVPLMVFISGVLASSSLTRVKSSTTYVIKRIKRLIIPTYVFLLFFYLCMALVGQLPDKMTILKSFFFQRDGGIAGYTWIIWIYIICGCLTPFLSHLSNNFRIIIITVCVVLAYELLAEFSEFSDIRILYYTVFTIIPYGVFLLFSIKYEELPQSSTLFIVIFSILFHIIYSVALFLKTGNYISINAYKYPARIYYYSYAVPIIISLLKLFRCKYFSSFKCHIVVFISSHSLWIYLWHIFVLALLMSFHSDHRLAIFI